MGNKQARPKSFSCAYCGGKEEGRNASGTICARCGTSTAPPSLPVAQPAPKPAATSSSLASPIPASPSPNGYIPVDATGGANTSPSSAAAPLVGAQQLRRVWLHPFEESVTDELRSMPPETVGTQWFGQYFAQHPQRLTRDDRFQINNVDFKVGACHPFAGMTGPRTQYMLAPAVSSINTISRVHLLPLKASLPDPANPPRSAEIFQRYIRPYFEEKTSEGGMHVARGDVIVANGVQFKVVACEPASGCVERSSEIFVDGAPLEDLQRVHLLPVYESLPNNEKDITADRIFSKYIEPHFIGRMVLLTAEDEIEIDGVSFKVVAAEPPTGVATLRTTFFADGAPLRREALLQQQMERDAEMARRLQEEEDARSREAWQRPMGVAMGLQEYRARLALILERMPQNHPSYPIVYQLYHNSGPHGPVRPNTQAAMMAAFIAALTQGRSAPGQAAPRGASADAVNNLPVHKYKPQPKEEKPAAAPAATGEPPSAAAAAAAAAMAEETDCCCICLAEYEAGDEVRTLQCMHGYHKDCIDKWLKNSHECPMCKMSVD